MKLNYDKTYVREMSATRNVAQHPDAVPGLAEDWLTLHAEVERTRQIMAPILAYWEEYKAVDDGIDGNWHGGEPTTDFGSMIEGFIQKLRAVLSQG